VPRLLVGLVVLLNVPGVISLVVWLNPRVGIFAWVGGFLSEGWESALQVSSRVMSFLVPGFFVRSFELLLSPSTLSQSIRDISLLSERRISALQVTRWVMSLMMPFLFI